MPDKALVNGSQGLGAARVHERQKRAFHVKQAHWYLGINGSNTPGHGLSEGAIVRAWVPSSPDPVRRKLVHVDGSAEGVRERNDLGAASPHAGLSHHLKKVGEGNQRAARTIRPRANEHLEDTSYRSYI